MFSPCFIMTKVALFYLLDNSAVLAQEGMLLLKIVLQRIFCMLFVCCMGISNS